MPQGPAIEVGAPLNLRHGLIKFLGNKLAAFQINIIHLGAGSGRGEIPPLKDLPTRFIRIYSCEANVAAQSDTAPPNITMVPYAISDRDGERLLYMCRHAGSTSFYRPNTDLVRRWYYGDRNLLEFLEVIETRMLKTRSLDSLMADGTIAGADFLRLNIQGGEFDALRGGQRALDEAVAIQIELSFDQTYVDAPLFSEIEPFLRRNGFILFDFLAPNEVSHSSRFIAGGRNERYWRFPGTRIFESHCLFLRDYGRSGSETKDVLKVLKLAAIAEMYGQLHFSLEMLNLSVSLSEKHQEKSVIQDATSDFVRRWQDCFVKA